MSREYQNRIRPIDEDGAASINALMRICYRKAKIAKLFGDNRSAEDNMRKFRKLKARLASRERVGRL